ncbi:MAG: ABC transporter permease [Hyphomicrobium sp.]|uniref:ABC transporter permease n=1 Tax=Hyphomicrobium sp. TaxID=82 RepID=UPI0025B7C206|nr:ABC transporter permease [Hyphomicrobium sp.]MBX9863199.1 ABC transporter permease [Hyphomicrobium sp.]
MVENLFAWDGRMIAMDAGRATKPRELEPAAGSGTPPNRRRPRLWAIRGTLSSKTYAAIAVLGIALPFLLWIGLLSLGAVPKLFMPAPIEVVGRFANWVTNEGFAADLWISVQRVTLGFALSLAIALPLGLLCGTFKPCEAFLEPAFDFVRYMPAVAFVPLMLLWCGIGEASKVSVIFIGTFFQMLLMFADDVRRVPMQQIEAAQTMGATSREILFRVILPSSAPALLTTSRVTLGWAWTYLVVAEMVAANSGIGYAILKAQRFLQTDKIFAGLIVIGLIGLLQDQFMRALRAVLFPYLKGR